MKGYSRLGGVRDSNATRTITHGSVRVYRSGREYVVSEHETWVAGVYASESAALRAPSIDVDSLAALWRRVAPDPITDVDLDRVLDE